MHWYALSIRRRIRESLLLTMVAVALIGCATVEPITATGPIERISDSPFREETWGVPFSKSGAPTGELLEARVYFPRSKAAPFPLLVLSHGSPRTTVRPTVRYVEQARWFADKGFLVVVPMRRGYGRSDGKWSENFRPCRNANYIRAAMATADDIRSTVEFFQQQEFVIPEQTILAGQSAGGLGSVAAGGEQIPGVIAYLNFSGGRGSTSPGFVCSPEALVAATGHFGKTTNVPNIWIYAKNDNYFSASLTSRMHKAFDVTSASESEYVLVSTSLRDGHAIFTRDMGTWTPHAERFLERVLAR